MLSSWVAAVVVLLWCMQRNSAGSENPSDVFRFLVEERTQCCQTRRVRYTQRVDYCIQLPAPIEAATNRGSVATTHKPLTHSHLGPLWETTAAPWYHLLLESTSVLNRESAWLRCFDVDCQKCECYFWNIWIWDVLCCSVRVVFDVVFNQRSSWLTRPRGRRRRRTCGLSLSQSEPGFLSPRVCKLSPSRKMSPTSGALRCRPSQLESSRGGATSQSWIH